MRLETSVVYSYHKSEEINLCLLYSYMKEGGKVFKWAEILEEW